MLGIIYFGSIAKLITVLVSLHGFFVFEIDGIYAKFRQSV